MAHVISHSYVLVTGGAGGIGAALCRLLPTIGLTPIVGYNSNADQAHVLAKECNGLAVKIDMNSDDSIAMAVQSISEAMSENDLLCGVVLGASPAPDLLSFTGLSSEHLLSQFRVNVVGAQLLLSGLIKKFFRKNKLGVVVGVLTQAIGSENQTPATGMGAYVVAKIALKGMLSVCAAEYPWLKVKTVSPGFTKTKMLNVFDPRYLELVQTQSQFSSPEDIAQLIIKEILS